MHTPQEAIAELEYSVETLGFKAVVMAGPVLRPIPAIERQYPGASRSASFLDTFCIDSEFDYDPVWAKCEKLKVVRKNYILTAIKNCFFRKRINIIIIIVL